MSDEEWAYAIILFDQPGKQALSTLVLATQRATKPFSDEYLDFLSEFIWQYLKSSKENPEYERDTATRVNTGIRLTRMIYASNSPRHVTAMKQIMNIMRKYVRMKVEITSLVEETAKTTEQYEFGNVDLEKVKTTIYDYAKNAQVGEELAVKFSSIVTEQSRESMLSTMGRPHAASATMIKIPLTITVPRVSYFYKGVGRIATELSGNYWRVVEINPGTSEFEFRMPYFNREDSSDPYTRHIILHGILHEDNFVLKSMASVLDRQVNVDNELLDVFAELMVINSKTKLTPIEDDTNAWLVKLLANKNGPRYKEILQDVAANRANKKSRKYARKLLRNIKGISVETFRPGSVDLEQLRTVYLPMYKS
jgi:hypothetical protein